VRRANIALFTVSLDNVGPARALLTLAERLDRTRFNPHVVTALSFDAAIARQLKIRDVPAVALGVSGPFDVRAWWRLAAQLRRWRIDLIHARLQRAGFFARVAAPFAGRPVVLVNVVNMYGDHFASQHGPRLAGPLRWVEKMTQPLVHEWVANSAAAAADLETVVGVPSQNVHIVANAVDPVAFTRPPDVRMRVRTELAIDAEELVIGTVARLVPLKRLELLIDAVARIRRDGPPVRLLVVGDGPSRPMLEEQARRLNAGVIFAGRRQDVADLLSAMDLFAFTSSSEGQPNVVLEAMAAGLPVVAVDIPGLSELVTHDMTGALVDGNPDSIAAAMRKILLDPDLAARMGGAARRRVVSAFSSDLMVQSFEQIYERALMARAAA
jgi:glycosyltransferase involved in cell wall biosynthesis